MAQVHRLRSNPSRPLKRKWRLSGNEEICLSLVLLRSRRLNSSSNLHNNNIFHLRTHSTNIRMLSTHNINISKRHFNKIITYNPNNIHIRICRARINSSLNQIGIIPIYTLMGVYSTRIQCRYRRVMADHHSISVSPSLHLTIIPI